MNGPKLNGSFTALRFQPAWADAEKRPVSRVIRQGATSIQQTPTGNAGIPTSTPVRLIVNNSVKTRFPSFLFLSCPSLRVTRHWRA